MKGVWCALLVALMATGAFAAQELVSINTAVEPTIDGVIEDLWNNAPEVTVQLTGGVNNPTSTMTIRSMHTADRIFFLFQWTDPTESLRRFPWVKQDDGTWKQLVSPDNAGGDENTYYEDKLAAIWNINDSIAGFNESGCFVTCHVGEGKPFGNKYTANPGEKGDIWHWKGVRTNPVGYADDQYLDDTRYDPVASPEAGRHSDPKDSGGYVNNKNAAGDAPAYMLPNGATAPPYWILDDEKEPFVDNFNPGDELPGIIVKRPVGDRGDIDAKGVWSNGKWTVELGRARDTGSPYDIQFTQTNKPYHFGVAVFDNAQVRHSWSMGALALVLEGVETSVDPAGKLPTVWASVKGRY